MIRNLIVLALGAIAIPEAAALCLLESGALRDQAIGSQIIRVAADAPADASNPIASYDSDALGVQLEYGCDNGTPYGKSTVGLNGQNPATYIYETNVPGIGVKLLWNNGLGATGNFPSVTTVKLPTNRGIMKIAAGSYFRAQFFKLTDNLVLSNKAGDLVLPSALRAFNYFNTDAVGEAYARLNIGNITIISTPVCTVDQSKVIDFTQVTAGALKSGVEKPLNFFVNCRTDYGTYSAKAMMTAADASADSTYIKVTDASGNKDRLGIRITDGKTQTIRMNDSTSSEQLYNVASGSNAQYQWKATLFSTSTEAPQPGPFNAKAEIVFNID
ncbi:fimbrial protein [Enterobacillus tribolii]|uniref:Type 1 fimbria pilin n=1 Tax=Enterobacillus tribolii TaxID=1487935 RepID=A0A370R3C4_9GAMM|nr:fimbrial protein [Enterobacillus tribolii]MBW7984854.1 fimbrial protein [Enterobacillus tribolii]RDK96046.1 type 1 fimbria pilin [Enterobacillus tribolii]